MIKRILPVLFAALLTLPSLTAKAQYTEGSPMTASRWRDYRRSSYMGLRFGVNIPTVQFKGTGGMAHTGTLPRFHVGFVAGQKLGNGLPFFFETGLYYTEKGVQIDATQETGERKITLRYLELPAVIKYKINTNVDDFTVQPLFGGFIALGVGGQVKDYSTRTKVIPFGDDRFKRFDAGLCVGCGAAFQNFYFEMAYDIGLFNLAGEKYADYHYDNFDGHIRTGCFTMSLGIDF